MSSKKNSKNQTVSHTDFEPSRLSWTDLEENDRSKGQKIAYPRYDHPIHGKDQQLFMQFPQITLFTYGVPRIGEYYPDDKSRSFIKVPIDSNDEEVMTMVEKFKKVDEKLSSDEFKKKAFGKKWKKYSYVPFVRESVQDEDDEVSRPDYLKLKLDLTWPEDKVKTKVYSVTTENGKKKRELVEVETVDDFTQYVNYQGKFTPIVRPVKMWAQPPGKKDPQYGYTAKVVMVQAEPASTGSVGSFTFLEDDDSDDDDEEEVEVKVVEVKSTVENPEDEDEDEDDDSDDSDSDSDDEVVIKKKKVKGKSKSKH